MRFELRKLLGSIQICLALVLVLVANGVLYWFACTDDGQGYTLSDIQSIYADPEAMAELRGMLKERKERQERLEALLGSLGLESIPVEQGINTAVMERIDQVESYQQYRESLINESRIKLMLGVMGETDSFSARSLELGIQEYDALRGVVPTVEFSGGTEMMASAHHSDLLLLVVTGIAGLILLTTEKTTGLTKLSRPTKWGGSRLWLRKLGVLIFLYFAGFIILYGTNWMITAVLFGFGDLSRPIQSVFGYNGCSMNISVGKFLASLLGLKFVWGLTCSSVIFCICSIASSVIAAGAGVTICGAVAFLLWRSSSLWARAVSLLGTAYIEKAFQGAVYLNWFGTPVHQIPIVLGLFGVIICVALGLSLWAFCRIPQTVDGTRRQRVNWHLSHSYVGLLYHEGNKVLIMSRAVIILVLLIIVQTISYRDFYINNSEDEHYYRNYSSVLAGDPTEEKEAFLVREQDRLDDLNQQWLDLQKQYADPVMASLMGADIQNALKAQQPFEKALTQYEGLEERQAFLYQTKYERLFDSAGIWDDLVNLTKLLLVLIFSLFGVFAVEHETGVRAIQVTAGREKAVRCRKVILVCVFVILAAAVAFVPQYIVVFQGYGWPELKVTANSISQFSALPGWCTIWMLFAAVWFIRLALAGMVTVLVSVLSAKTQKSVTTLIISLVILVAALSGAFIWLGGQV